MGRRDTSALDVLRDMRRRVFYAFPDRLRSQVASRLPDRALLPEWRGKRYWDDLYGGPDRDPFRLDSTPDEHLKYAATLELCGPGPFASALEIGCSIGTFTELLAPRCERLLATDISQDAVTTARERLVDQSHVEIVAKDVTRDFPEGPFDLIVASDVLYYWTYGENVRVLAAMEAALHPGGALVLFHYVPRMGSVLNGTEVHDLIAAETNLTSVFADEREYGAGRLYRVDRYECAPALSDTLLGEARRQALRVGEAAVRPPNGDRSA